MDRINLTIEGREFSIAEKLFHVPSGIHPRKYKISDYDVNLTCQALLALGFDLSRNRIQAKEYISVLPAHFDEIAIEPRWTTLDREDVFNGTVPVHTSRGRVFDKVISPRYRNGNYNIIRIHEYSRYNNTRKGILGASRPDLNIAINRINNKGVAISQHPESTCVFFDIDNHNYGDPDAGESYAIETVTNLFRALGFPQEIFIERSYMGGFHVGFRTTEKVKDSDISAFVRKFNTETGSSIEARLTSKAFRLPNHFTYTTGRAKFIDGRFTFVPFDDELCGWKHHALSFDSKYRPVPYDIFRKHEPLIKKKQPLYSRYKDHSFYQEPMRRGRRDKVMWSTACYMCRAGYSEEAYYDRLCSIDEGSDDWASWDEYRRRAEASRTWNNARQKTGSYVSFSHTKDPDCLISSTPNLPDRVVKLLDDPRVISFFNVYSDSKNYKTRERTAQSTRLILAEIIGKAIYEENHRRIASCRHPRTKHHLEQGYQFPRKFIDRVSRHYDMVSSGRRMASYIINECNLFNLYDWDGVKGRYSSNGDITFCRQYVPFSGTDIVSAFCNLAHYIISTGIVNIIKEPTEHGSIMCPVCIPAIHVPVSNYEYFYHPPT